MIQVIEKVADMRDLVGRARREGKTIGLVPTMGALHDGHLTLIREAKKACDMVVVSIFVNPTQFGPNEDFDAYPRTWLRDLEQSLAAGADVVLHPAVAEMYPDSWSTWVTVEGVTNKLCGKSRPAHFRGVATVVTKLFNIAQPDKAFFGQKDAQQVIVITKMVRDLNMPLDIVMVPTVREADGLARSSRNKYLNSEERTASIILNRSLHQAKEMVIRGETEISAIRLAVAQFIESEPLANIEYVEIYSFPALEEIAILNQKVLVAVAAKFGATRLIDNIILEPIRK